VTQTKSSLTASPFIAGAPEDHDGGDGYEIREPATDAVLATGRMGTEASIDRAVGAAHDALKKWRRVGPIERSRLLHAIADAVAAEAADLCELEARNVGKAISSVRAEVQHVISTFRYFASVTGSISGRAARIGGAIDFSSYQEPVGVVAQIVPWNYPLLMAAWKIAPALAAGCSTIVKPDPVTPLTALRLAQIATEVGVPAGVVNVVPADGPTVGSYLVSHPGVAKVAFTGSTRTGIEVMRAAAQNVSRVTLELGGKGANVVFPDADLDDAVAGAVWSAFSSAGQSCEARTRTLVHSSIAEQFTEAFVAVTRNVRLGDPLAEDTVVGSLISRSHRDRVHGFVERAVDAGSEVLLGGDVLEGAGAYYPLTLVRPHAQASEIVREEVFGPVATIEVFDTEDEAVAKANDTRFGLLATVWSRDSATAARVAHQLDFGTVGINHPLTTFPGVPFGGVKHSGFGREFSLESLHDYLETKSITNWISPRSSNVLPTAL